MKWTGNAAFCRCKNKWGFNEWLIRKLTGKLMRGGLRLNLLCTVFLSRVHWLKICSYLLWTVPPLPIGHPLNQQLEWPCVLCVWVCVCIKKCLSREGLTWDTCSVRTDAHNAVRKHSLLAPHFSSPIPFLPRLFAHLGMSAIPFFGWGHGHTYTLPPHHHSFFVVPRNLPCLSFLFVDMAWDPQ